MFFIQPDDLRDLLDALSRTASFFQGSSPFPFSFLTVDLPKSLIDDIRLYIPPPIATVRCLCTSVNNRN